MIAQCPETLDHSRKIDLTLADRYLLAELVGIGRVKPVFGVDRADVLAEDIQRIEGIGFSVQDQIGSVQADSDVIQTDIPDDAHQCDRGLLPGLEQERLAIPFGVLRDFAYRLDRLAVEWVGRSLRNEPAMCLQVGDAEPFGEIRRALEADHPGAARGARNQPDGGRTLGKIPDVLSGSERFQTRNLDLVPAGGVLEARRQLRGEIVGVDETGRQPELVNTSHGRFGSGVQFRDNTQRQIARATRCRRTAKSHAGQGQRTQSPPREEPATPGHAAARPAAASVCRMSSAECAVETYQRPSGRTSTPSSSNAIAKSEYSAEFAASASR